MLFVQHIRWCSRNFAPPGTRRAVWAVTPQLYWRNFCEIHVELFWFQILSENKTEQTKVVLKHLKSPLCSHDWQTERHCWNICFCVCQHQSMCYLRYNPTHRRRQSVCPTHLQPAGAPPGGAESRWSPPSRSWRCTCTGPRPPASRPPPPACVPPSAASARSSPAEGGCCWRGTNWNTVG